MQANNNQNQVPSPTTLLDGSLIDLLHTAISQEDLEEYDKFLLESTAQQMNSTLSGQSPLVTGMTAQSNPSTQMPLAIQMSSQVASAQPLLMTQMVSMGKVMQLTSTKQMVALGQIVQTTSTAQSGQIGQSNLSAQPTPTLQMTSMGQMMQSPHAPVLAAQSPQRCQPRPLS